MEAASRLLAPYEEKLAPKIAVLNDTRGEGVRISLQCAACMTKRQQLAPVYVSAKGDAKTVEAAGRIAAERILNQHAKCVGLLRPPEKRSWLESAVLDKQDAEEKKAKTQAAALADTVANLTVLADGPCCGLHWMHQRSKA